MRASERVGFGLRKESVTWDMIGRWTSKDYDTSYDVVILCQPQFRMDTMIGSTFYPNGKPYKLSLMYFLKGGELLVCGKRIGGGHASLDSVELIDLRKISLITKPAVSRKNYGFFFARERAEVVGESYFEIPPEDHIVPFTLSFSLRYPSPGHIYAMQDALRFSDALKRRIGSLILLPSPDQPLSNSATGSDSTLPSPLFPDSTHAPRDPLP